MPVGVVAPPDLGPATATRLTTGEVAGCVEVDYPAGPCSVMEVTRDHAERVDRLFTEAAELGRFGGTVAVSVRGQRSLSKAYGAADALGRVRFDVRTAGQIASVSKQFTAAAVLLLAESGTLSTDDPLSRWVRPAPVHWEEIRLHHLLSHTSGLPHWRDLPDLDLFGPVLDDEIVAAFASRPLKFSPGTGWAYSSPGYHLLALAVEAASGRPYAELVRQRILSPLGLRHTYVGNRLPEGIPRAQGLGESGPVPSFDLDSTGKGAGDVWSTAEDLLRWDDALSAPGTLLSAASLGASFRPHGRIPRDDIAAARGLEDAAYGYGWYLATVRGAALRFHSGDNPGFRALNVWVPGLELQFALTSNTERTDTLSLGLGLLGCAVSDP